MFFKKYSWPVGIVVTIGLFMAMTLFYVQKAFSERVDLVATDYYYRDKVFSDRLDREKKMLRRGTAELALKDGGVAIHLPDFFNGKAVSGNLYVYSPLNPAEDFSIPLKFTGNRAQVAAKLDTTRRWRVSLDFTASGEGYYFEKVLP